MTLKNRTFSSRRPGLSPRPQQKSPIAVLGNLLLVPGGLRKPQTSLGPSRYIPDRIGVHTDHKRGLIACNNHLCINNNNVSANQ